MTPMPTRRRLLATVAAVTSAGLAGCGAPAGDATRTPASEAAIDVFVFTDGVPDAVLTLDVLDAAGDPVEDLSLTGPLVASDDPRIGAGLFATGLAETTYTVRARLDGPGGVTEETTAWDAAACPRLYLDVEVPDASTVTFARRCEPKTGTPAGRRPGERANG